MFSSRFSRHKRSKSEGHNRRHLHGPRSDTVINDSADSACLTEITSSEEDILLNDSQAFSSMWSFTKSAFKTSLLESSSHELEDVAARMFNSTLVYAGLETSGKHALENV